MSGTSIKNRPALIAAALMTVGATLPTAAAIQKWPTIDYPTQALRERRQGTTHYRVVVDQRGRSVSCEITKSSGSDDLDKATCKMMRSARFAPATDADGKPIKSTYQNKMLWRIPY